MDELAQQCHLESAHLCIGHDAIMMDWEVRTQLTLMICHFLNLKSANDEIQED